MPLNVVRADICVRQAANIEPHVCLVTSLFVPDKVSQVRTRGIYGIRAAFFYFYDHKTFFNMKRWGWNVSSQQL